MTGFTRLIPIMLSVHPAGTGHPRCLRELIIGPGAKFVGHIALMQQLFTNSFGTKYNGPWVHATNRFLGLEVTINGQKHLTTLSGWRQLQGIHLTCPHHPESCSDLSQSSWEFSH